ncbi:M18 family aminopeptidase [Kocuria palustris]|uniref:M18 family aminopeptidase n=1 Tax=Kocuria palustris TaxID=71999 RepID=UPI0011A80C4A|nr:M18 family aminopeptidase [Kocuria palustris]
MAEPLAELTPSVPADPDWPQTPAGRTAEDLGRCVMASPSSFHAAAEGARRLEAAGFQRLDERRRWTGDDVRQPSYVLRDGALIAWAVPERLDERTGFRVLGAHTDSPSFKLKPRPSTGHSGWRQIGVEVYGGPLLNSWLDRELRLAGRVAVQTDDGVATRLVATEPVARIPQLAIHLDRTANKGLALDPQQHMQPVWGCGDEPGDILDLLARSASGASGTALRGEDLLGWDVVLADTQPPRLFGTDRELLASGRLDNLTSVHAGLTALTQRLEELRGAEHIAMLAAFDHEEVGSRTRSGAAGPFLEDVLVRVGAALGWDEDRRRAVLASSSCLSADAGHLVHPNHPGHHDPANRPRPGGGPLLKINADQHYTTDADGAAQWRLACRRAGVPTQEFVSHNAVPCGSTIGPITAGRLGMRTLDVGVGLLSMHSAREMVHVDDLHALGLAVQEWLLG